MPTFTVKSRTTLPDKVEIIEAETRELAVHQVLEATPEGASTEVMQVIEEEAEAEPKPAHAKTKKEEPHHSTKK